MAHLSIYYFFFYLDSLMPRIRRILEDIYRKSDLQRLVGNNKLLWTDCRYR